ncbi:MAG: methyl-accepting chemotaxis protein [Crocinitomicaceae bacterium]|jgi:methyl-accepting chemotaxis protein
MMLSYPLGFKNKLHLVIAFSLLGFTVISTISFNALQALGEASTRVNSINQDTNLLKDLQLQVLQLSAQPNVDILQQLLPLYGEQLEQVSQRLPAEQAEKIHRIHLSLQHWVSHHLQWLTEQQRIGLNNEQGYRKALSLNMTALETSLFSNFRKSFNTLNQAVDAFIEHGEPEYYEETKVALAVINQQTIDLEFAEFFGPKITEVTKSLKVLADSVSTMNTNEQKTAQAYLSFAAGVRGSNQYLQQELLMAKNEADTASIQAQNLILGVCIIIALLVVGLLIRISRDVVSTLERMSEVLHKLADGDLTQRLDVNEFRGDELDTAGLAVNKMTEALGKVFTRVTHSSQTLDQGATALSVNLSAMVTNNSQTDEEAASVAAGTEQISTTIRDMASATEEAHQQARQAHLSAVQGGAVITAAIESLEELGAVFDNLGHQVTNMEKASGKVDGVTEMINSLAQQTNLLALNAAIEAARAGDAGKGFSVVADEVRNLASKTVMATQNITTIISVMQCSIKSLLNVMQKGEDHINKGRELGGEAATAINQIKQLVLEVTDRNQTLAINIDEVSKSTQMIAESMVQVSGNISQNTKQSQEIKQYVHDASEQATELLSMTKRFRCSS